MREYILILLLTIGFSLNLNAQVKTCDCKSDLIYLNQKIEKLPSFKKNKRLYKEAYKKAFDKASAKTSYFDCLEILNKLVLPLNDWHIGVIGKAIDSLSSSFVNYPVYNDNLENLNNYLKQKSIEAIEGVYQVNKDLSFGLVFDETSKAYNAVILKSKSDQWNKGDILYKLFPLPNGFFKLIGAQYPTKRMISYHERINQGIFLRAGFKKDTVATYFIRSPYPEDVFVFKEISPKIDYLKVGSFSSQYPLLKEAEDFYTSLKGNLVKPHLILDLRDNGGGGDRNSDILLKQLKKYLKSNNVYIITNARTGSNAEQFTVKLKQYKNVICYGDKTRGALSYEIKPDDYYTLPSSSFLVILPSKAHKKYLEYETNGVAPDVFLEYKKSWISIVVNNIENKDQG